MFKAKQNETYSSNVANGFNFRKKLNKEQRKFATRIPFSLIAKNKSLSKNLFGIVTTNELDFNIQAKPLSNTHFISFSYEEYINKIIKPKLSVKNLKLTFLAVNNQTNILKNITNNNEVCNIIMLLLYDHKYKYFFCSKQ